MYSNVLRMMIDPGAGARLGEARKAWLSAEVAALLDEGIAALDALLCMASFEYGTVQLESHRGKLLEDCQGKVGMAVDGFEWRDAAQAEWDIQPWDDMTSGKVTIQGICRKEYLVNKCGTLSIVTAEEWARFAILASDRRGSPYDLQGLFLPWTVEEAGNGRRRRDCHFDAPPSSSLLNHLLKEEGGAAE